MTPAAITRLALAVFLMFGTLSDALKDDVTVVCVKL